MKSKLKKLIAVFTISVLASLGMSFHASESAGEVPGGSGGCIKCGTGEPEGDPTKKRRR